MPQLGRWLSEPHVAEWWGEPGDVEANYGPSIDGKEPARCYVVSLNGEAIGMIETHYWRDWPKEMAAIGAEPDEAGLDYLIGDPDLIGRGLGQEMLRSFIADVVLADPSIKGVRTNVSVANRRSWRCLEKLGFTREPDTRLLDDEPGPQYVLSYRSPSAR